VAAVVLVRVHVLLLPAVTVPTHAADGDDDADGDDGDAGDAGANAAGNSLIGSSPPSNALAGANVLADAGAVVDLGNELGGGGGQGEAGLRGNGATTAVLSLG
jgi:hypothetical protein